jgi:hypothetical protein
VKKAIELLEQLADALILVKPEPRAMLEIIIKNERLGILAVLAELKALPRWETPEQREKRTGEKWSIFAPVWVRSFEENEWPYESGFLWYATCINELSDPSSEVILCAYGPEPPPKNWRPDGIDTP